MAQWPRVRITDPMVATVVRSALEEGTRLLANPECHAILTEFQDSRGDQLATKLGTLDVDINGYLRLVIFVDGWQHELCDDALAFTAPGSRVVRVCARSVLRMWRESSERLVFALLHEVLHTLGLGENPPSSEEITEKVRLRCGASR